MALIERLQEQLTRLSHPDHARTKRVWIGEGDQRRREDKRVPVKPWWRLGPDGKVVLSLRSGMKKIEFEKGKTEIVVGGIDELPQVLQGLIDAVGRGDLGSRDDRARVGLLALGRRRRRLGEHFVNGENAMHRKHARAVS